MEDIFFINDNTLEVEKYDNDLFVQHYDPEYVLYFVLPDHLLVPIPKHITTKQLLFDYLCDEQILSKHLIFHCLIGDAYGDITERLVAISRYASYFGWDKSSITLFLYVPTYYTSIVTINSDTTLDKISYILELLELKDCQINYRHDPAEQQILHKISKLANPLFFRTEQTLQSDSIVEAMDQYIFFNKESVILHEFCCPLLKSCSLKWSYRDSRKICIHKVESRYIWSKLHITKKLDYNLYEYLRKILEQYGYEVVEVSYKQPIQVIVDKLLNCDALISHRSGMCYLAQILHTPTILLHPTPSAKHSVSFDHFKNNLPTQLRINMFYIDVAKFLSLLYSTKNIIQSFLSLNDYFTKPHINLIRSEQLDVTLDYQKTIMKRESVKLKQLISNILG